MDVEENQSLGKCAGRGHLPVDEEGNRIKALPGYPLKSM